MYVDGAIAKLFSINSRNLKCTVDNLAECIHDCQLSLASSKCEHLHILYRNNDSAFSFTINSHELHNVVKVKDFGVLLISSLKWSSHISQLRICFCI